MVFTALIVIVVFVIVLVVAFLVSVYVGVGGRSNRCWLQFLLLV